MNINTDKAYIYQPLAADKNKGKIFRVVFKDKTRSPLLTKKDAEHVLSQQNKLSIAAEVRRALAL